MANEYPTIWSNMRFWQSPLWCQHVRSIYSPEEQGEVRSVGWQAWQLFRRRRDADLIVTMGVRESMAYALICALLGLPSKQVMLEVFLDQPQPQSLLWRLKTRVYGWLAGRAVGLITNSEAEIHSIAARYQVPPERMRFVPLCSTIPPEEVPESPGPNILAAGRTLRDFPLLVQVAEALPQYPFRVICGHGDLQSENLPDNLQVLREIDLESYLEELRAATLVVIPLQPTERSTGQVVLLEAMAMGKAVIATRSPGMIDYIRDRETGWLVQAGDAEALQAACEALMNDVAMRQQIGHQAQEYIKQEGAPDQHAEALLSTMQGWR